MVLILPFFFDSAFAVCILQKQNQGSPENAAMGGRRSFKC